MAIQEAERWNILLSEMRRSLAELDLGLKGDLTMTEPMASVARGDAGSAVAHMFVLATLILPPCAPSLPIRRSD